MKNIFFILLFSFLASSSFAQEFASHNVKKGETVYSIAKQYGISESLLYQLNPDVKNGIKTGDFLIVPAQGTVVLKGLKKHRVKRKETIKSIALKYNITQDALKKYNKDLYARGVKKGEKINIPVFGKNTKITTPTETAEVIKDTTVTYLVVPKETKYGIARKYGITIIELEALNPSMGDSLQIGQEIVVPNTEVLEDETTIEAANFEYYEVLPKEGFFRLKIKLGLSEEEIIALNPYAKEGLKEGMILKIPKESTVSMVSEFNATDLENFITNSQTKRLAVMLPFKLNKVDTDSINTNKRLIKSSSTLRAAIDFYSGVLMATEFAKDKGISIHLDVYDTAANPANVSSIIDSKNFNEVDAVIGPLLSKNVEKAASKLQAKGIPVFSPLSKKKLKQYNNLYQTIPSKGVMKKAMLDYLKRNSDSINFVVITGKEWTKSKGIIMEALPEAKSIVPQKDNYFNQEEIKEKLDTQLENWIILDSNDPILVSNVIGLLNGLPEIIYEEFDKKDENAEKVEIGRYAVRLFAVDKTEAFSYNDISNLHLANLNFTYPSVNKGLNIEMKKPFLVSYKNKYGVYPNRFAVRGFDLTYDVILRLASSDNLLESVETGVQTEYIENKFQYIKNPVSGYLNNAFYIIKYNEELNTEVVE